MIASNSWRSFLAGGILAFLALFTLSPVLSFAGLTDVSYLGPRMVFVAIFFYSIWIGRTVGATSSQSAASASASGGLRDALATRPSRVLLGSILLALVTILFPIGAALVTASAPSLLIVGAGMAAAILGGVLSLLLPQSKKTSPPWTLYVYTEVVIAELSSVLFVDEMRFGAVSTDGSVKLAQIWSVDFQLHSYAEKWELFALVATLLLAFIFWIAQMRAKDKFKSGAAYFMPANAALGISLIIILIALVTLTKNLDLHFLCVIIVAVLFSLNDLFSWLGIDHNQDPDEKESALRFLLLADLPALVAFLSLGAYYHWIHTVQHAPGEPWMFMGRNTYEFFLAGAIAFQLLASNMIFLTISWDSWLRPLGSRQSEEATAVTR